MLLRRYGGVTAWWDGFAARVRGEDGATAVEYALMVALIAMVVIAAVSFVGKGVSNQFSSVGGCLNNTAGC